MRPSTLLLLAAGGFAVHLLPQVGELRQTLDALRTARWAWLLVGLALAAASYLAAAVNTAAGVLVHVLGLLVAALLIGRSRVGAAHIPRGWPLLVALAVALAAGGLGAMEAALVAGLTAVGAPPGRRSPECWPSGCSPSGCRSCPAGWPTAPCAPTGRSDLPLPGAGPTDRGGVARASGGGGPGPRFPAC